MIAAISSTVTIQAPSSTDTESAQTTSRATIQAADYLAADGVTDDRAAFQTLVDDYVGYEIQLPANGSIAIDGTINLPSDTYINGQGCTIQALSAAGGEILFQFENARKLIIYDCVLDGNSVMTHCLLYSDASFVSILSCTIQFFLQASIRCPHGGNHLAFFNNIVQDIGGAVGVVTGSSSSYTKNAVIVGNTFRRVGNNPGDWAFYASGPPSEDDVQPGDFALQFYDNTIENTCFGGVKFQMSNDYISLPVRIHDNVIAVAAGGAHTMVVDSVLDAEIYNNTHRPEGGAVIVFSNNGRKTIASIHDEIINVKGQATAGDRFAVFAGGSAETEIVADNVTITLDTTGGTFWSGAFGARECASFEIKNCVVDMNRESKFFYQYGSDSIAGINLHDNVADCKTPIQLVGPCAGLTVRNNTFAHSWWFLVIEGASDVVTDLLAEDNTIDPGLQWGKLIGITDGIVQNNHGTGAMPDGSVPAGWGSYSDNTNLVLENNTGA